MRLTTSSCSENRNNRLVWGAMIAIATISKLVPETLYPQIEVIQTAMD